MDILTFFQSNKGSLLNKLSMVIFVPFAYLVVNHFSYA